MPQAIGFMTFAPVVLARGPVFGATARGGNTSATQSVTTEKELYAEPAA